jgi:mRNA-degrading endonuclease RelE of RelBE toxin-antitoxin system
MVVLRFLETHVFTQLVTESLDEEAYGALQTALLLRPEQGPVIPGSGGLRKIRWGAKGSGKRGGLRLIYYWDKRSDCCYMVFLYRKNRQGDLTAAQTRMLAKVVREEFS